MYIQKHFDPRELVTPEIWKACGIDSLRMYHPKILEGADMIRDIFGPVICNTWHSDQLKKTYGLFTNRGLRNYLGTLGGAIHSKHKLGIRNLTFWESAIDLWPLKTTPQKIHAEMRKDQAFWLQYFTRVEEFKPDGSPITWFHGDNGHTGKNEIHFFRP